ncbi:DUF1016 N-terminal domain-containing protein [Algoriphagus boritolerans]|uniref:DUF1016 N-terminal domain-containing protein n=1 Tax=Algoriphagus boritolerans TaxID=308111 RepID=UPI002FCE45F3
MIEQSRNQIAVVANSALTLLFWKVGKRISDEILNNERAEYGKQIIATISAQLEVNYGRNFTEKNVRRMIQFVDQFPEFEIVVTLSRQLSWSHFFDINTSEITRGKELLFSFSNYKSIKRKRSQTSNITQSI